MDRVEMLVLAARAEAAHRGITVEEMHLLYPNTTERLEAVVDVLIPAIAEHIRHIADVREFMFSEWIGMHMAADEMEKL